MARAISAAPSANFRLTENPSHCRQEIIRDVREVKIDSGAHGDDAACDVVLIPAHRYAHQGHACSER
jgi:hypothetical protein